MSPEYSAWLRENPTLLALIVVAVLAGLFVLMAAVEWFGTWLIARSERRRASPAEARP